MQEKTHVDVAQTVAVALGWRGDTKLLAKNAAYPDEVHAVEVEGLGAHAFGYGLSSLCHFCRPVGDKSEGYCYKQDMSLPHLDFTQRKVVPKPTAWGSPIIEPLLSAEPFGKLVHDLSQPDHHGSLEADQFTFTSAAIMVEWVETCYRWSTDHLQGAELQQALDVLSGWACHFIEDCAVPHHAVSVLLMGHSAFEGDVDQCWNQMRGDGTVDALLKTMVTTKANFPSLRALADDVAERSYVHHKKLEWRCIWRRGWDKMVRGCVLRGLSATYQCLKFLQGIPQKP